jgi:hypothetical protein
MTRPSIERVGEADPRTKPFQVPTESLSGDALENLVSEYCTRAWGLNETESPESNRHRVFKAVRFGELVVWFDPVENSAALDVPEG